MTYMKDVTSMNANVPVSKRSSSSAIALLVLTLVSTLVLNAGDLTAHPNHSHGKDKHHHSQETTSGKNSQGQKHNHDHKHEHSHSRNQKVKENKTGGRPPMGRTGSRVKQASCRRGIIGQTPKILMIAGEPMEPAKGKLIQELARKAGMTADYVHMSMGDMDAVANTFNDYDLIIFDNAYTGAFMRLINPYRGAIARTGTRVFQGPMAKDPSLIRCLDRPQVQTLKSYWMNGGPVNFARMMEYLRSDIFKLDTAQAQPPIIFPAHGLYHPDYPDRVFASLDDYLQWRPLAEGQPVIGVGIHRIRISDDMTIHIDQLVKRIENAGAYPLVFFDPNNAEKNVPILYKDGKLLPDVFINFTGLYTNIDQQKAWNEKLDRVTIQALSYPSGYEDDWRKDKDGYPFYRMSVHYTLSEMSGRIDATMVAAKRRSDEKYTEIPEQMQAVVERALNYTKLKRKQNEDKKIALLVWNSPEGEENFSASYLNIPQSLERTFDAMRAQGYVIPAVSDDTLIATLKKLIKPYYRVGDDKQLRLLLREGLAEKYPLQEYQDYLQSLPQSVRTRMTETWGSSENSYLVIDEDDEKFVVIPRVILGNVTLLPQPLRGARRDREADIFHDKKHPLHHAYRSVYFHLTHRLKPDAFVHYGTHGSQEWLDGKERAQSIYDDTQSTIGNIPVIYPYIVANASEGLNARRRGRATIISHNSPPFAPAGLYGDLVHVNEIMHQLHEMEEGKVKENAKKELIKLIVELKLDKDIGVPIEMAKTDWPGFENKLHAYLEGVGGMPQPLGLQTFGEPAPDNHILLTILQILGPDYIGVYETYPDHYLSQPYDQLEQTKPFQALKSATVGNKSLTEYPEEARPFLEDAKRHYANFVGEQEIESFLNALSAGYVPTGTGNDPLRNPDAVPTGRNTYVFDPRKIPTKAAWGAGQELLDGLIEQYRDKHGTTPNKMAFSMWSTETFKHFGVVESQILYALGVRPKWNKRGQVTGVELIPTSELKRPRIDTVLSITGLYRDNLPSVMKTIQDAINMVATLKEEHNHVYESAQKIRARLIETGMSGEEAAKFSKVRLFGVESGEYGTHLPEASLASDTWEGDDKLAKQFIGRMGTAFGTEKGTRNVKLKNVDLFSENLRGVKAAVLSRSTNNHGLLSLDHTFEYLGGLGMTVRYLDGKTPELFVADLRNTRNFKTQTAGDFIATELRSRYYHPRWISELKKENYAGANEILNVINNTWGWDVMDPTAVRDDQWQEMFEIYTQDKLELGLDEWFKKVHPAAMAQISERMLEAVRKGYWQASEDTQKALVEKYLSIAAEHDLFTANKKFKQFLKEKAAGFGLQVAALQGNNAAQASAVGEAGATKSNQTDKTEKLEANETKVVEGMKLEKKTPQANSPTPPTDQRLLYVILGSIFALGFAREFIRG